MLKIGHNAVYILVYDASAKETIPLAVGMGNRLLHELLIPRICSSPAY